MGDLAGDEVVQVYITDLEASVPVPIRQLGGMERIHLRPGSSKEVTFTLRPPQFSLITDDGRRIVESGAFRIAIGGCQPGYEHLVGGSTQVLSDTIRSTESIPIREL